jgi:hypothetical protein
MRDPGLSLGIYDARTSQSPRAATWVAWAGSAAGHNAGGQSRVRKLMVVACTSPEATGGPKRSGMGSVLLDSGHKEPL